MCQPVKIAVEVNLNMMTTPKNSNSKTNVQNRPPASGERAAVTGYLGQYGVAADIIIHGLSSGKLEWIALADRFAGRVDDFQIGTLGRIDAYQVKWSQFPRYLTLNQIVTPEKEKPNLFEQLADGWKRLSKASHGARVVVHLLTNNIPSPNDSVRQIKEEGDLCHFAAFLSEAWHKVKQKGQIAPSDLADSWSTTWNTIRTASGLTDANEFCQFIQDCELDLNCVPFDELKDRFGIQLPATNKDFWDIRSKLFELVADRSQITKLSREALLAQIGWKSILTLWHGSLMSVTPHYQPIVESEAKLKQMVTEQSKGYLLVSGDPGSGKSTILAKLIPELVPRSVVYYAYLPGSLGNKTRGESESFLHDITLQLERQGLMRSQINPEGRAALLDCFQSQLLAAGDLFRTTSEKTCIVVDGLDHIDREQHTNLPLYADLPDPAEIPDGVLFILSSQHKEMLSTAIKNDIREYREVTMSRLNQEAVATIVQSASKHKLDAPKLNRVFTLTQGHPLALQYLSNELESVPLDQVEQVLDDAVPFSGEMENYYSTHWDKLPTDVQNALAQIALLDGSFDIRTIHSLFSDNCPSLIAKTRQYFFKESTYRWLFFHNSFRQFVLHKSVLNPLGEVDEQLRIKHRYQLCQKLATLPQTEDLAWQRTYHLEEAQAPSAEVADSIDASSARLQLQSYRELPAIRQDISTACLHAARERNVLKTLRLLILESEFRDRIYRYEENDFDDVVVDALIELKQEDNAMKRIRAGNTLRVSRQSAFKYARRFQQTGSEQTGKEVFRIAEPYFESNQLDEFTPEFLMDWAYSAAHFNSIKEIGARICGNPSSNQGETQNNLLSDLFMAAGIGRIHSDNSTEAIELLEGAYVELSQEQRFKLFEAFFENRKNVSSKLLLLLDEFIQDHKFSRLQTDMVLKCLEWAAKNDLQVKNAHAILTSLTPSEFELDENGFERYPIEETFRYFRLLAIHSISISQSIHNTGIEDLLSAMSALINGATALSDKQIANKLKKLLAEVRKSYETEAPFPEQNPLDDDTKDRLLIAFIRELLPSVTNSLSVGKTIASVWDTDRAQKFFSPSLKRNLVQMFIGIVNESWIKQQLSDIELIMLDNWFYVGQRMVECARQCHSWLLLKQYERAENCLHRMLALSYGIDHKMPADLTHWSEIMQLSNSEDPSNAPRRINVMVSAMISAYTRSNNGHAYREYEDFLRNLYTSYPTTAAQILIGLQQKGYLRDAARAFKELGEPRKDQRRPKYPAQPKPPCPSIASFSELKLAAQSVNLDWNDATKNVPPLSKKQAEELRRMLGNQLGADSALLNIAKRLSDKDYAFELLQDILRKKYLSPGLPIEVLKQMRLLNGSKAREFAFQILAGQSDYNINFHIPQDLPVLFETLEFTEYAVLWETVQDQIEQMTKYWGFSDLSPLPEDQVLKASDSLDKANQIFEHCALPQRENLRGKKASSCNAV